MKKKNIVLVVAHEGYQEKEYGITAEILMSNNIHVITASDEAGVAYASDQSTIAVDKTLDQIDTADIDGLFLIGGQGALACLDTPKAHDLVQQMETLGKPLGSICISTRILAHAGVLKGKKATGWNKDGKLQKILEDNGAHYENKPHVVDDHIITAEGPEAAQEFAQDILKVLHVI